MDPAKALGYYQNRLKIPNLNIYLKHIAQSNDSVIGMKISPINIDSEDANKFIKAH